MTAAAARLLVLDRAHRILLDTATGGVPEAPAGPLAGIRASVRARGLDLGHPIGSRQADDGRDARDFVFVVPPGAAPAGFTWIRLADHGAALAAPGHAAWLWSIYVDRVLGGWEPPTRALDVFHFGDAALASPLAHLVVCGDKRGTAAWLRAAALEGSALPEPGTVSVVTDAAGLPRCVIRTEELRRLRFGDADEAIARLEGEGDLSLEDWREAHRAYFEAEAARLGLRFSDDEEILVERFRVLHVVGRADASGR